MKNFPEGLAFRFPWRKYQSDFLKDFEQYIDDNHLHVVAPPGSGKTVLGIEMMLRLGKPTLIVVPTIALKHQWLERFLVDFLQTSDIPEWISTDIRNPKMMTIATYQGIYAASIGKQEEVADDKELDNEQDDFSVSSKKLRRVNHNSFRTFVQSLESQNIKTFILDEAHHLKNAWWSNIIDLKTEMNPTIVALTATPPYDVQGFEWARYIELNGPIDAEISVPELMLEKDLCPHRDLVYVSLPTEEEQKKIEDVQQKASDFIKELKTDEVLLQALRQHPVYQQPMAHLDWIYAHLSSYTSGLVYLNFRGIPVQEHHFEIIGDDQKVIPELNVFWLEELLDFYIFVDKSAFKPFEEHQTRLENRLRRSGFIDGARVAFFDNKMVQEVLNSSIGKLDSILKIVQQESASLGEALRMVVLTDFIQKEFLDPELAINKLGAIPIFEFLRRVLIDRNLALLTGSMVILPQQALERLSALVGEGTITKKALYYDNSYVLISKNSGRVDLVRLITQLFEEGYIHILVGTQALLGEGWDCPKINSLVLASVVSSFVQSNQMRGRAIRTDSRNPRKTSNIWHLVSYNPDAELGNSDMEKLRKRFLSFVGISNDGLPYIENDIRRLDLPDIFVSHQEIENSNAKTLRISTDRQSLDERWKNALAEGRFLAEKIELPTEFNDTLYEGRNIGVSKAIQGFSMLMVSSGLTFFGEFLLNLLKFGKHPMAILLLPLLGIIGILFYGRRFYVGFRQYLKYRTIEKNLGEIAAIIIRTLIFANSIKTPEEDLKLQVTREQGHAVGCYMDGGNRFEKSKFILTLQDFVSRIDNPRYLLRQTNGFWFWKKQDYYPLPEVFGRNKKIAEFFLKQWNHNFGNGSLVFTRTVEGRKLLLKIRFDTMLRTDMQIRHLSRWVR